MAHGQFEHGVGEVVGAELVVLHSGLSQDRFGHELLQERGVSRLFKHRSQLERQFLPRGGQAECGDLRELGTACVTQSKELGLGEGHVPDSQGRGFGGASHRQEERQACQESLVQECLRRRWYRSGSDTLLHRAPRVTAYGLVGHCLFRDGSCCMDGRWGSFDSC